MPVDSAPMKYLDRFIAVFFLVLIAAVVLPAAGSSFTAIAVTGTVCFIAIRAAMYFTGR